MDGTWNFVHLTAKPQGLATLAMCAREGWLLEFYVLAISKVISGCVATYDSAHTWRLYSAASMGDMDTFRQRFRHSTLSTKTAVTLSLWLFCNQHRSATGLWPKQKQTNKNTGKRSCRLPPKKREDRLAIDWQLAGEWSEIDSWLVYDCWSVANQSSTTHRPIVNRSASGHRWLAAVP